MKRKYGKMNGGGKAIFCHGTTSSRGVAIFATKQMYQNITNIYKGCDGRTIILDINHLDCDMTLVAIYAPNADTPQYFKEIASLLKNRHEHKVIVGDFNLTMDPEKDRKNTYHNNNNSRDELVEIMDEFYLKDLWRERNEDKKEYSWHKKIDTGSHNEPQNMRKASRIDMALITGGLDQQVKEIMYLSSLMTDHRAIYMVIQVSRFERGTGYWKFNNTFLQNSTFVEYMNKELDQTISSSHQKEPMEKWEIIKKRIKTASTKFARAKTNEQKLVIAQLSEKVNEYEERLPLDQDEDNLYEQTKSELEDKVLERIAGVMFRSKARWYEEGEKNTKYFYSLEKAKYNAETCYKILDQKGEEVINPQQILQEQKEFYQKLYEADEDVSFNMDNTYEVFVPDDIRQEQDIQISLQDLQQAIKGMNNNKTPGQDGIPVNFYKVFWDTLKEPFNNMMLDAFNKGALHSSAREGILNLIPKANKDTRLIKNLRPITLLNTDYKIIEKAIANKMIPALQHIIHTDQRGFMKDRRISVNIRKMLDVIHQAEKEDLEAVVLSLDFVKCFDKCSFSILHGSLDFFKFGEIVKKWTKILYNNFSVKVQNNGHFSEEIMISKGVHQGGCCSSVYFLVIAEILALSLRSNQDIDGICINNIRNLLNQFADDMDIFSLCNEKSIKAIWEELSTFRQQSGFTVSYEKTTLYRIGSLRHSSAQLYDLSQVSWSNQDITVLGVTVAHEDLVEKNYKDIGKKIKGILNSWNNRNLSLIGKIQVINTLIASLFVYKMMVLPIIPQSTIKEIENILRNFIWNGKKSKIAYSILQNQKDQGGLNLVNFRNKDISLKATWPLILKFEKDYENMVYSIMRCKELGEYIWRCNLAPEDALNMNIHNPFWKDVLYSWSCINYFYKKREENQIIWYNSLIRLKGKPFMWKDIFQHGLIYVHQLFQQGQYKSNKQVWEEFKLPIMRYNSLKAAIPASLRDFYCQNLIPYPIAPHTYDQALNFKQGWSKKVYQYINGDISLISNKYVKWTQEMGQEFSEDIYNFGKLHLEMYRTTNIAKYRSLQYRILQRGLVTNIQLKKWSIMATDLCTYCTEAAETVVHLFTQCRITCELWNALTIFLGDTQGKLDLGPVAIITNRIHPKAGHIANFLCLLTKYYIYSQRCLANNINRAGLFALYRSTHNIEKYIAIKNNRLSTHRKKWFFYDD